MAVPRRCVRVFLVGGRVEECYYTKNATAENATRNVKKNVTKNFIENAT